MTDISPSIEECVLSKQEIIDYLNLNFPQNEEVSHFIKGITNYRQSSIYKEFSFDKDHKLMAIVLDLSTPLTLFKDVSSGKFCKSFLKGIDEVVLDQKGGVYYIRVNGLERKCFLMHHKINEFDQNGNIQENCVYEESEINYELKGFFCCCKKQ